MQRLFTALAIPEKTASRLVALQPPASKTVRPVEAQRLHLTLVFIGQADVYEVVERLEQVPASGFDLQIEGLGKFDCKDGGSILWAGVQRHPGLSTLYQKIANALKNIGDAGAAAEYVPHLTLARCKKGTPNNIGDRFLSQTVPICDAVPITKFGLYSSTLHRETSVYQLERAFPLSLAEPGRGIEAQLRAR